MGRRECECAWPKELYVKGILCQCLYWDSIYSIQELLVMHDSSSQLLIYAVGVYIGNCS